MDQHLVAGHGGKTGGIGGTGRMETPHPRGRGIDGGRADSGGASQADHKRVVGGISPNLEIEGGVIAQTTPQVQRVPQRAVGSVRVPSTGDPFPYVHYFHDPNGIRLEITTPLAADWNDRPEVARDIVGSWLEAKREAEASGRPADEVLRQAIAARDFHE